jgi:spore maturation protein CgeB
MYRGYLDSFYEKNPDVKDWSYQDHYNLLMNDTTEFAGSYTRHFLKLGINTKCIVSNDSILQGKWMTENNLNRGRNSDIIFDQVRSFEPDILWLENLSFTDSEWFSEVRKKIKSIKLIIAYHCAPFNKMILEKLKNADFIITCTPGLKKVFEDNGIKTYLVYHGFDSELTARIQKRQETPLHSLVFSGSLITGDSYHNSRIDLIESLIKEQVSLDLFVTLEKNYRIKIKQLIYSASAFLKRMKMHKLTKKINVFEYGRSPGRSYSRTLLERNRSPIYGIDMYNLFSNSKVVLNMHADVAGEYAGNMRMFEVTGVGSCLLTDNKKNISDLFEPGKEIVVYDNPEDCVKKVKWLLEHDNEREEIARMGRKRTMEMNTVEIRCKSIIDIINKELSSENRNPVG